MTEERNENAVRRRKLEELRRLKAAYPYGFVRSDTSSALHSTFGDSTKEQLEELGHKVVVAGRMMLKRNMGKASFITIQDGSAPIDDQLGETERIQCYVRNDQIGADEYAEFIELSDIGDMLGVVGTMMKTNRGELTVQAQSVTILAKALHPLPEKFHGLSDQESRYRKRYVDLIVNEASRRVFRIRSQVVTAIRQFFTDRDYLEVETPMMHSLPGGAIARPFQTHHNALDLDLYLRVAPELFLKRLVVGGFERVFEINRNFRNEGLSTRHNPEFTMLEFYSAYETYEDFIDLTTELLRLLVAKVQGAVDVSQITPVTYGEYEIDFSKTPKKISMRRIVAEKLNVEESVLSDLDRARRIASQQGVEIDPEMPIGTIINELFEAKVEKSLIDPTYVTDYPASISPLARRNDKEPIFTDRFELFVAGHEIANGFNELNDPDDQRQRFIDQVSQREGGDQEAMYFDADYIEALEFGLPPTAGEGIGIDRLVMLLTNSQTIRDVLLFPHMRPVEP